MEFKKFKIPCIDSPNFLMNPVELKNYIDFEVKRVYFITNSQTGVTGSHCHKVEEELFLVIQGGATAVIDHGAGLEEHRLQGPSDAIYVGNYVWHHFKDMSKDTILLAISSTNYNPNREDYIEDYETFRSVIANHKK